MKEVLNFVVWKWRKWEFWQKCYIVGAFFFGLGIGLPEPVRNYFFAVPITMVLVFTGKWFMWDQVKDSWLAYKKEKEELFETIKDSHK